ncbi:unnamed protein product [Camellia sinensis]
MWRDERLKEAASTGDERFKEAASTGDMNAKTNPAVTFWEMRWVSEKE